MKVPPSTVAAMAESGEFPPFDGTQRPGADEHGRQLAPEDFVRWLGPACWEDRAGAMHFDIPMFHRWLGLPDGAASIEETAEMMAAMLGRLYAEEGVPDPKITVRRASFP